MLPCLSPFSRSLKSSTSCGWPIFSTSELSCCICVFCLQYSFSLDENVFVSFMCNICPPSTHQILPQHVVDPFSPLLSFIAACWVIYLMFTNIGNGWPLVQPACSRWGGWGGFRSLKSSSEHLSMWLDWVCPVDAPDYFGTNTITNTKYTFPNTNRDRSRKGNGKYPDCLLLFIRPDHWPRASKLC